MDYLAIKNAHVSLAILSVALFLVRAAVSINKGRLTSRAFRIIAHTIDTCLLALGGVLVYMLSLNPFTTPWLALKLTAIVAYIVCGAAVIKGRRRWVKVLALGCSLALVAYIVFLAVYKNPWG